LGKEIGGILWVDSIFGKNDFSELIIGFESATEGSEVVGPDLIVA